MPRVMPTRRKTATDAITLQTDVIGPEGDNQGSANGQADHTFGYGDQMGLAVFDGQVYPVWAGNLNQSSYNSGTKIVTANPLNIFYRPMVIAAGPRIINSTMGPITLAEAMSGSVSISVTFDRLITASTFVTGDVEVFYKGTSASAPFISLFVTGISPSSGSATDFTITFDPTRKSDGSASGITNFTGTYSYMIAPDNGAGLAISSPVATSFGLAPRLSDPMDQNADGTSDENAITTSFLGVSTFDTTPGDVYAVPAPLPTGSTRFDGATSILTAPLNPNTLPLIVPGPQVLSTSVPGGDAANGNLITDGTASSLSVTFDRPMEVASFTPAEVDQIMGPAGSISGPQFFPSTTSAGVVIGPATSATTPTTVTSTLTVPSYNGTFTVGHIALSLTAAFSPDSALTAILIAPDGTPVTLFSGIGGTGANFINTTFDDLADNPITSGAAPFTGAYRPANPLAALIGHGVDMPTPLDSAVFEPGVWTLKLINAGTGASGMLDNWSLSITPQITVMPVSPSAGTATTFDIKFPQQQLSGTYTIQIGPNIVDAFGDAMDTNQNAGLAALRGQDQKAPTTPETYTATDLSQPIPAPAVGMTSQVSSIVPVSDDFTIPDGDLTEAGASVMQVEVSISYPTDADLTATLTHIGPDNAVLGQVILFSGVGTGSTTANFNSTVFDDHAVTPIQNGNAPFGSTYAPQESFITAFGGQTVAGTWVLTIVNNSTKGASGTFNGWTLTIQKPLPTSGLGEPGSDDFSTSFRIFTLAQADSLSSEAWTAVGPASIGGSSSSTGTTDPSGRVTGLAIDPSDPSGNTVYAAGASGGIWKTTDFLTTVPAGPTWIPLTDFGPTSGVNIGGIAIFPRNNDPNQSIVIAATGEGDTGTPGVGFLVSQDGGATWVLDDSANNVDASGNPLPIASTDRNRQFVGDTSFAVVVDPTLTTNGGVIIYAAMSGTSGGIWRSEDTGKTWTLMLSGQATSVVLAPESGTVVNPSTGKPVQGNEQVVYAAIRGVGVYMSPNQGQVWNEMLGGVGNPLIFDQTYNPAPNINPTNGPTPNGGQGRIELAVPSATGNVAEDQVYEGWLYAIVATPGGTLDGIFVTKDYGANWTEVRIPTEPNLAYQTTPAIPTNDVSLKDYSVIGDAQFPQGNYNIAIAVDPVDPSVIYVGGTADGNQSALIRINLTTIWDAHALVASSSSAGLGSSSDSGQLTLNSTGPATVSNLIYGFPTTSYLNLIRNPGIRSRPTRISSSTTSPRLPTTARVSSGSRYRPVEPTITGWSR